MDFYAILGVRPGATADEIRRAYRRLARRFHPGINPGDAPAAERFRQVTEAYETLADPARRQRYDALGGPEAVPVASRFEFAGFDFSLRADGARAHTFGELFADALGGGAAPVAEPKDGADLHVSLTLSFEEAARGGRRTATVTRLEHCRPCAGTGLLPSPEGPCHVCEGAGRLRGVRGHMVFSRVCPACTGAGIVRHRLCRACGGEGVGPRSDAVPVDVPPGLADGAQFSVAGQGHAGRRGGPPGNLRVTVSVLAHRFFRRDGDDLRVEVPIAVHEAALGARIDVPSLEGPVRLRVPPGTQSGQILRLRERGLTGRDGRRGDLLVTVRLVLPAVLDERSKELMRELAELHPESVREDLGV